MLLYPYSWSYIETFSLLRDISRLLQMFFENDGHFGRHPGFRKEHCLIVGDFKYVTVTLLIYSWSYPEKLSFL